MISNIDLNSQDLFKAPAPPKKELDKDAFLQLLIAQLRHQDPLEPIKDQEFIGQLAQLNALEASTNLNKSLTDFIKSQTTQQAASFVGMDVSGNDADGNLVQGTVTQLLVQDGEPILMIGDKALPAKNLISAKLSHDPFGGP